MVLVPDVDQICPVLIEAVEVVLGCVDREGVHLRQVDEPRELLVVFGVVGVLLLALEEGVTDGELVGLETESLDGLPCVVGEDTPLGCRNED